MREADWFTSTEALAAVNPSRLVCKKDLDVKGEPGWELPLPVLSPTPCSEYALFFVM